MTFRRMRTIKTDENSFFKALLNYGITKIGFRPESHTI
jgi:hypothetical protein